MGVAWILTFLALGGALVGVLLGRPRLISSYLAAGAGGLLLGISLFWLVPEIAATSGWLTAAAMTAVACALLAVVDRFFLHSGSDSAHSAITPLLIATALHSFVDGWSVRALQAQRIATLAAPLGLALHKIPEGLAIGWLCRQAFGSPVKAVLAALGVELATVLGAYVEPNANNSGFAAFGIWWTASIIAVVSGSFLFLGIHSVLPYRRKIGVMLVFAATLLIVGTIGLLKSGTA